MRSGSGVAACSWRRHAHRAAVRGVRPGRASCRSPSWCCCRARSCRDSRSAHDPGKLDRSAAIALFARRSPRPGARRPTAEAGAADAATHLGETKRLTRIDDFERVMQTVLYCRERWDGQGGFPGILGGDAIPVESRVLAVAEQLGSLTAAGTRGLSPEQAYRSDRAARRHGVRSTCRRRRPLGGRGGHPRVAAVYGDHPRRRPGQRERRWSSPSARTHSRRIPSSGTRALRSLGLRVLRPPVCKRLGTARDDLGELLELLAVETGPRRARIPREQVGERAGRAARSSR